MKYQSITKAAHPNSIAIQNNIDPINPNTSKESEAVVSV